MASREISIAIAKGKRQKAKGKRLKAEDLLLVRGRKSR
jgi:hypothetical protein